MQFQPKAEDECKRTFSPIPKGEYEFEVLEASDETSKSGNDMIKINIAIWQGENVLCRIFDYLLPAMEAKLRHACDACGLLDKYQSGNLHGADFVGCTGRVKIKIKNETADFPAKNEVEDYCLRPAKGIGGAAPETQEEKLPF